MQNYLINAFCELRRLEAALGYRDRCGQAVGFGLPTLICTALRYTQPIIHTAHDSSVFKEKTPP